MKKRSDPRHLKRREVIRALFAWSFSKGKIKNKTTNSVINNLGDIDRIVTFCAPQWPIEKIGKIDLAILRLAIYELKIAPTEPPKVIIDEAVELSKEFGGESTPGFVNGVLGTVVKKEE